MQKELCAELPVNCESFCLQAYPSLSYVHVAMVTLLLFASLKESIISCVGSVDRSRYLLGDQRGRLLMLFLEFQDNAESALGSLTGMKLEVLGEVSLACMCTGSVLSTVCTAMWKHIRIHFKLHVGDLGQFEEFGFYSNCLTFCEIPFYCENRGWIRTYIPRHKRIWSFLIRNFT